MSHGRVITRPTSTSFHNPWNWAIKRYAFIIYIHICTYICACLHMLDWGLGLSKTVNNRIFLRVRSVVKFVSREKDVFLLRSCNHCFTDTLLLTVKRWSWQQGTTRYAIFTTLHFIVGYIYINSHSMISWSKKFWTTSKFLLYVCMYVLNRRQSFMIFMQVQNQCQL